MECDKHEIPFTKELPVIPYAVPFVNSSREVQQHVKRWTMNDSDGGGRFQQGKCLDSVQTQIFDRLPHDLLVVSYAYVGRLLHARPDSV